MRAEPSAGPVFGSLVAAHGQPRRVAARATAPSAAPLTPDGSGLLPIDFVVTAMLRRRLLAGAFLLPCLAGLAAAALVETRFNAQAVLVALTAREGAGTQGLSGFGPSVVAVEITKAVRSEAEILRSVPVVQDAVAAVGPARLYPSIGEGGLLSWLRPAAGEAERVALAAERFARNLRIDTETGSNVLRISFPFPDRALAVEALEALLAAYYERRRETFAEDGARLVGAELARRDETLRALETRIQQVKTEFGVLDIGQEISLTAARLDGLGQREDRAREQQATSSAQLAAARTRLAAQPGRVLASEDTTNVLPNDDARNQLTRLLLEQRQMASNYQPDYAPLRELERRIEVARNTVESAARTNLFTRRQVRNPTVELLAGRVAVLEVETDAWRAQAGELQRQRAELEARRLALLEAERRLRALERQRGSLEAVTRQFVAREAGTRLDEAALSEQPPSVRTVQAPTAPWQGQSPRLMLALGGVVAGLMFAAGVLIALTLGRRSLATPSEAERGLRLPALGVFGRLETAPARIITRPEAADLAALLLDARVGAHRPQIIRFVAPAGTVDEGAALRMLAVEFARNRGLQTLLVDLQSDGRGHLAALGSSPLEVERVPGQVLTFSTVIPNLWVSYEARESRLLDPQASREQVELLTAQLRDAFDVVMVLGPDGGEDTYAMARLSALVDANVMLLRSEQTNVQAARAARDFVQDAGGHLLGFVVTEQRQLVPAALGRLL
ncbi:GumC family protein [Falsiroseomonas sp. HC035]|uniref:GumC family protein n=1 Tax=Falsiroseomonas sp. HC035 TaxID=3390999 RepID=UPI003D3102F8